MAEILITDITTEVLDGTGAFDSLMRASKAHLFEEYSNNKIRGTDYANVYLGAMQATMQMANSFVLEREQAGLKADLLAQQILKVIAEVRNTELSGDLVQAQIRKTDAEISLIGKQETKVDAEVALLKEKLITEQAATQDITAGTLGKQQALYQKQADGFDRDAEQKLLKVAVDTYSMRVNKSDPYNPAQAGLGDPQIKDIVDIARIGISLPATPTPGLAPIAIFTTATTATPLEIQFTDASTFEAGVTLVTWNWTFGDSGSSSEQHPLYLYGAAGSYTARLEVTDSNGQTDSATQVVVVA